jgi:Flp pilus assembly pilin Flp
MDRLLALYIDLKTREDGQGMVEYALILVFVAAVAALALSATTVGGLGADIKSKLDGIIP